MPYRVGLREVDLHGVNLIAIKADLSVGHVAILISTCCVDLSGITTEPVEFLAKRNYPNRWDRWEILRGRGIEMFRLLYTGEIYAHIYNHFDIVDVIKDFKNISSKSHNWSKEGF